MKLFMTQAEFARYRGVARQTVAGYIERGRIKLDPATRQIDVAAADLALGASIERIKAEPEASAGAAPIEGGGLTQARTETEIYRARIARLDYERRVGEVLATEDVTRSMEHCAGEIVRALELMPARADDLAAALSRGGVPGLRKALRDLARNVRRTVAEGMKILAAESDDDREEGSA